MDFELNLSSPWVLYYHELEAFFKKDPHVSVVYDAEKNVVKLFVYGDDKAEAIMQLLPSEMQFGNVTLKIEVIPANYLGASKLELFRKALEGNEAVSYMKTVDGLYNNKLNFIVFANEVVQYFTDDLGDINHVRSTLYQDIAKELFGEHEGIFYCTDKPES